MATSPFESAEERPLPPPITAHPAFPSIVALWFAVLLGLGSLVLPAVLLERLIGATGLGSMILPLGFVTRAAIAVIAALAGAALGRAIARRVASAPASAPDADMDAETDTARSGFGTKRPISVHEELGGEGVVNGHAQPLSRRRALLIAEADEPDDSLPYAAAPDEDAYPSDTSCPMEEPPADDEAPLELSALAEEVASWTVPEGADAPAARPDDDIHNDIGDDNGDDDDLEGSAPHEFQPVSAYQEFAAPPAPIEDAIDEEDEPLDLDVDAPTETEAEAEAKAEAEPYPDEPLAYAAPSLSPVEFEPAGQVFAPEPLPEPEPAPETEPDDEPALRSVAEQPAASTAPGDWQDAPLEDLGLVQLAQRLSATIEKRREWIARSRMAPAAATVPLTGVEAAHPDDAAEAMTAYFGSAPGSAQAPSEFADEFHDELADESSDLTEADDHAEADIAPVSFAEEAPALRPAFLRGLSNAAAEDDEDDDDGLAPFSLPLARTATPLTGLSAAEHDTAEEEEEDDEESLSDGSFRSLLAMRPASSVSEKKFVRFEETELETDPDPETVFSSEEEPAEPAEQEAGDTPRLFDPPPATTDSAAPQAPEDTDAALRAALATLQRMGGTG